MAAHVSARRGKKAAVQRHASRSTAATAKVSFRDAMVAACDLGILATEAMQQVLRGAAEGIDEVVRSHRAVKRQASVPVRKTSRARGRVVRADR